MAEALDPRRNPYRPDLAASWLAGRVSADAFVLPQRQQVIAETASIQARPEADAMQTSELLHGEPVDVFEEANGWAWCQSVLDGYVGFVSLSSLSGDTFEPTHLVNARLSHVFPQPSIKDPPVGRLTLGARIAITGTEGRFARLSEGGYVIAAHLRPLGEPERDPLDVALRCLNAPYLWGGRSSLGLDCSGLLQVAHQACGLLPPRDSDMQREELGEERPIPRGPEGLRRNDLVFFPGHCMIADGAGGLVHANATHMMVTHEPADTVFARTPGGWGSVTAVRNATPD